MCRRRPKFIARDVIKFLIFWCSNTLAFGVSHIHLRIFCVAPSCRRCVFVGVVCCARPEGSRAVGNASGGVQVDPRAPPQTWRAGMVWGRRGVVRGRHGRESRGRRDLYAYAVRGKCRGFCEVDRLSLCYRSPESQAEEWTKRIRR